MKPIRLFSIMLALPALVLAASLPACERKPESPTKRTADSGDHAAGDDHDHDHDHGDEHDHHDDGPTTELGEQSVGGFMVKASRDGGIKAGSDAAIDVWVTGGSAKVTAVRFWIGTQDGKGSVKAKAEIEKDNWHTHAEIPNPMPPGSKLWVEVETDKGEKHVLGFDLKS